MLATEDLRELFASIEDTHELVLRSAADDPLLAVWRSAAAESRDAYNAWAREPCALRHAAYIAAEERADAALGGYSSCSMRTSCAMPSGVSTS